MSLLSKWPPELAYKCESNVRSWHPLLNPPHAPVSLRAQVLIMADTAPHHLALWPLTSPPVPLHSRRSFLLVAAISGPSHVLPVISEAFSLSMSLNRLLQDFTRRATSVSVRPSLAILLKSTSPPPHSSLCNGNNKSIFSSLLRSH